MVALAEKIYEQALDLPIDDRLILIDKLLHSTNLPTQTEIDQAWAKEVELRCKALENGKAKLIPGEEVFEKIKKRFLK
ncbi:MAG: addiction module protein [Deltaproteobacteria bacterium]|nr:addiction module protein [Deltaproteobacteria bacterium]